MALLSNSNLVHFSELSAESILQENFWKNQNFTILSEPYLEKKVINQGKKLIFFKKKPLDLSLIL